ncbi:MAG: prepilin peptidase [Armatimonadota bacterium]|nr:prepilin peptidase [Armatimonadota bacterium]
MGLINVLRLVVLALALPAAVWDVWERRIPNFLSLPALAVAAAAFVLDGARLEAMLVLPVLFVSWSAGWIGGGDAKLLMALALAFGPWPAALATAVAGLAALAARRPMPGAVFALPAALGVWLWGWFAGGS